VNEEDAGAVGVPILSGAHMTLVPRIVDGLRANGAEDVLVVVGGTIPQDDADELKGGRRGRGVRAWCHDRRDRRLPAWRGCCLMCANEEWLRPARTGRTVRRIGTPTRG
jgi:hypothetical protein